MQIRVLQERRERAPGWYRARKQSLLGESCHLSPRATKSQGLGREKHGEAALVQNRAWDPDSGALGASMNLNLSQTVCKMEALHFPLKVIERKRLNGHKDTL